MKTRSDYSATTETLRQCHARALALLQDNLNPMIANYFKNMRPNSAYLIIDVSAPQYIRNIQVILNLMLIVDRALTTASMDTDGITNKLYNWSENYDVVNDSMTTFRHFNLTASPETQDLLAVLRHKDSSLFDLFVKKIPEATKLTQEMSGTMGSKASVALAEVLSGVGRVLNQDNKPQKSSSRGVLEDLAVNAAPKLEQALEQKDENQRYILNPEADGEIITSIKRIGNSLDYLSEALSFEINAENGRILSGFIEGLLSYKEVIDSVCSLSPAVKTVSADLRKKIRDIVEKFKPLTREIILNAVKMEREIDLLPGFWLDQIRPHIKRYYEFTKNIGMTLSAEEEDLFFSARQQLRLDKQAEIEDKLTKITELKAAVDQVDTLLHTTSPIANFNAKDLQTLKAALPLLPLPEQLKADFEKEVDAAMEGSTEGAIIWGYLKNFAGHDISLQNKVWRAVKNNFEDIESHQNDLESRLASLKYSQLHEYLNEKPVELFTLKDCEFFVDNSSDYFEASQLEPKLALVKARRTALLNFAESQPLRLNTQAEILSELSEIAELKAAIEQIEPLLCSNSPITNFNAEELQTLKTALPLLPLPEPLKTDFTRAVDSTIEDSSDASLAWGILKDLLGHDLSLQNQVWNAVISIDDDSEARQNDLESQLAALKNSQLNEYLNVKPIEQFTLEDCEFCIANIQDYTDKSQVEHKLALVVARRAALENAAASAVLEIHPTEPPAATSQEELAQLNQQINARNIKMADVTHDLRAFLLKNINAYFSQSIVDNFQQSEKSGFFEIYADDPKHIQDMKNFLSALTALENIFRAAEKSCLDAIAPAMHLKTIASRFNLNYQQETALVKLIYNGHLANIIEVNTALTADTKSGFRLKRDSGAPEADDKSGTTETRRFFDLYNKLFSYSEYVFSYLNIGTNPSTGSVNLMPYVAQMRNMEELVQQFLQQYFDQKFAQIFTRNTNGLYEVNTDDAPLVKDAKSLLNALHHTGRATTDVNAYLQGTFWDLPAVLKSVSTFVKSLNEVNLSASHTQICELHARLLATMQTAVDTQINPIIKQMMQQADTAEQAIGLRQGILTNPVQSAIDFYQAQSINAGIKVSDRDDEAFLVSRTEERAQFLAEAKRKLLELELIVRDTTEQFALIDQWYQKITDINQPIPSLRLLLEIRAYIRRNSEAAQLGQFIPLRSLLNDAPMLDMMINNYNKFLGNDKAELMEMSALIREQIIADQSVLKANLVAAENALIQFKATKGYRIAVIEEHQQTLAQNAENAIDAKQSAAVAVQLERNARDAMNANNLEKAKYFHQEAQAISKTAKQLAVESHSGTAKREAAAAQFESRHIERDLQDKQNPKAAPEVEQRGYFGELLLMILKIIVEILDAFVLTLRTIFLFSDKTQKHHTAAVSHWDAPSHADNSDETAVDSIQLPVNEPVQAAVKFNAIIDQSKSNEAARKRGFHSHPERQQPLDTNEIILNNSELSESSFTHQG